MTLLFQPRVQPLYFTTACWSQPGTAGPNPRPKPLPRYVPTPATLLLANNSFLARKMSGWNAHAKFKVTALGRCHRQSPSPWRLPSPCWSPPSQVLVGCQPWWMMVPANPSVVLAKPSVPVKPLGGCPKPSVVLGCHALSGRQALGRWLRSSWREPGGAKFVLAKLFWWVVPLPSPWLVAAK